MGGTAHTLNGQFAIIGQAIDLILDEPDLPEAVKEACEDIERSLDFSAIALRRLFAFLEMGRLQLETITVAEFVKKVEILAAQRIPSNVQLNVEVQPAIRAYLIETDLAQVQGVVLELINNASRALSEQGGRIKLVAQSKANNQITFYIRDNGPGVPSELRKALLKQQVLSKRGMGLGLFLSSKIIHVLGGSLRLVSSSKKGTSFAVSLPLIPTKEVT